MIDRIVITEKDTTGVVQNLNNMNTVLVAGFADGSRSWKVTSETYEIDADPKDIADFSKCPVGVPIVCNNISTFKSIFGSRPAVFCDDQYYIVRRDPQETTIDVTNIQGNITINDSSTSTVECTIKAQMPGNDTVPGENNYQFTVDDFLGALSEYISWSFNDITAAVYDAGGKLYDVPSGWFVFNESNTEFNLYDEVGYGGYVPVDGTETLVISGITLTLDIENTTNKLYYTVMEEEEEVVRYWSPSDVTHLDSATITYIDSGGSIQYFDTDSIPNGGAGSGNIMFEKGSPDPSYIYALELLSKGMVVAYVRLNEKRQFAKEYITVTNPSGHNPNDEVTVDNFYSKYLAAVTVDEGSPYNNYIVDTNTYPDIKYITAGGYPTFGWSNGTTTEQTESGSTICNRMLELAAKRGDCIALLDHTNNPHRVLYNIQEEPEGQLSVYAAVNSGKGNNYLNLGKGSYGAMYTPWALYNLSDTYYGIKDDFTERKEVPNPYPLPASFNYLCCAAGVINSGDSWQPVAGVVRGFNRDVVKTNTDKIMTSAVADYYQSPYSGAGTDAASINGITNISPYGIVVWGNRTLNKSTTGSLSALCFMSIRNIVCDVKKYVARYAKECMFEQNTDILFGKFSSKISSVLDNMQTSSVLAGYTIVRNKTSDPTKVSCTLTIYPTYAVESFEISINISDQEVVVE